jgi:hypothetical protein
VPTIEQRYESAVAVITEIVQLAGRLAIAVAAHDADAKRTINRLCREHIAAAFRVGGDDASVKTILDGLEQALRTLARMDKSELPGFEAYMRGVRNLGQGRSRRTIPKR